MSGRRLVLLRHGRTAWNSVGRFQGHQDIELDDVGRAEAAAVAPAMAALAPVALWTSDLTRARQTCRFVEDATGLMAKTDERLREFDVGARQGLTSPEFAESFPEAFAAWSDGEEMVRVPGSEVASEVEARIVPALRECLGALAPGETGVVVTHGASLKVGIAGLLGWSQTITVTLRGMDNCAWSTLLETDHGGRLRLVGYNEHVGA